MTPESIRLSISSALSQSMSSNRTDAVASGPGKHSQHSDSLQAGQSRDLMPVRRDIGKVHGVISQISLI